MALLSLSMQIPRWQLKTGHELSFHNPYKPPLTIILSFINVI